MNINAFINFFGGIALFLFGMKIMSESLENRTGGKLKEILNSVSKNKLYGILVGAGTTAAIQSSSALTVLLVGFVNSGLITFEQSVGMLMGSNIGTTMTSWIVSLLDISGDNLLLKILNPKFFTPFFAIIGAIFLIAGKNRNKIKLAHILLGFSVLMYGILIMSDIMKPLSNNENFVSILTAFNNPLIAFIAGVVFTAIIQSSSASIGVLQTLTVTGSITYKVAIPIIIGLNIGTCVTALISAIGVNKNAKKVAVTHLLFNVIGAILSFTALILIYLFYGKILNQTIHSTAIALIHTAFNIFTTMVLSLFTHKLTAFVNKIVN